MGVEHVALHGEDEPATLTALPDNPLDSVRNPQDSHNLSSLNPLVPIPEGTWGNKKPKMSSKPLNSDLEALNASSLDPENPIDILDSILPRHDTNS